MTCSTCQALEHSEPAQLAAVAKYALDQSDRKTADLLAARLECLELHALVSEKDQRIGELVETVKRLNRKVMSS